MSGVTVDIGLPDLHRHLDGSLRATTLRELAKQQGNPLQTIPRFTAGMGLDEALACFDTTLAVLQDTRSVRRVAAEICEDAAAESVTTLEIRFAPQLHQGASMDAIVDAALDGIGGRAGVILCALYGEPPELVERIVQIGAAREGVVGLDLAGGPAGIHTFRMEDYEAAFDGARRAGLGRTVHAAEGRPAEEIRVAVERLHAQRIGHGTTLLTRPDVVELVLERGVTIEACPTSNVHTGAIPSVDAHPIVEWLEAGVSVCVNPDNTLLSQTDAREEHRRVREIPGMTDELLRRCIENGHAASFRSAS